MDKIITIPILVSLYFIIVSFFIIKVEMSHKLKLFILVGVNLMGFFIWTAIPRFMGYATIENLPNEWVLVWSESNKPDYIEILLEPYNPLEGKDDLIYKIDYIERRFYRIPYDEQLDQALSDKKDIASKGVKVVFKKQI